MIETGNQLNRLLVLGVTGGIGSGKTTVCRHLEHLGATVFYADLVARDLMNNLPVLKHEIMELLGEDSYDATGRLNRPFVASRVFGNQELLHQLNQRVHPRVRAALADMKNDAIIHGFKLLVYEAALLLESGGREHVDAVAVVHAPEHIRINRVVKRDQVNEEQVNARISHQLSPDEMIAGADFIINNDADLYLLLRRTEKLKARFETLKGPPADRPEWIV